MKDVIVFSINTLVECGYLTIKPLNLIFNLLTSPVSLSLDL